MTDPAIRATLFVLRWCGAAITFRLFDDLLDAIAPLLSHLIHFTL